MQIQLKQREIEEALKGYINKHGISLLNKEIIISFTAGRKDSGLSADICIEDAHAASQLHTDDTGSSDSPPAPLASGDPPEEPVAAPTKASSLFQK